MNKRQICEDIGIVYGKFFVEDGLFCIDNDEKVFYYHSEDALLVDWLDTLLESHYNEYHIDEEGKIWDSWEKEIIFIYEEVFGKFPAGVRPVENKSGRTWKSFVDLSDGSRHGQNLHLGTYSSIVDAIFARQKFLDQAAYINRNQPNFFDDYLALAAQIKADMQKVQESRVEIPDDYDNKPSLSEQIISASSRTGESQFIDKVSAKAPAPER